MKAKFTVRAFSHRPPYDSKRVDAETLAAAKRIGFELAEEKPAWSSVVIRSRHTSDGWEPEGNEAMGRIEAVWEKGQWFIY